MIHGYVWNSRTQVVLSFVILLDGCAYYFTIAGTETP
jgi:hypothetical protein